MRKHGTYRKIGTSMWSGAVMRSLFGGIIMLWASTAVVQAAEVRQPTREDVKIVDRASSNENVLAKRIEEENARVDRLLKGICRGC